MSRTACVQLYTMFKDERKRFRITILLLKVRMAGVRVTSFLLWLWNKTASSVMEKMQPMNDMSNTSCHAYAIAYKKAV